MLASLLTGLFLCHDEGGYMDLKCSEQFWARVFSVAFFVELFFVAAFDNFISSPT